MAVRDAESPAEVRPGRLRFDRYVLDRDRGALLLDGSEIPLRPKTFALLHHLVANSGRLVSKEELFAAAWPNLAVTDDVLVQSIGELRRAFGEDGSRLIKTVSRRGYRFEAAVEVVATRERHPPDATQPPDTSGSAYLGDIIARAHPPAFLAGTPKALRAGILVSVALAILLAGLWGVVGSDWFSGGLRSGGRSATVEVGAKPAIAVLPFLNQSDESAREYFAEGLTQDIINALGRFSALTVMSWNAVFPYKGKPASPGEIARKLAVRYQVEGNVRLTGDRVRVSAQLINSDGHVLWSGRFDESLVDVFALQDRITTQIAGALAIRVTQFERRRALAKPTENLEAYDLVLRARPALQRPTRASNAEARGLLRRAIELDPNYAAAYAGLAETYHIAVSMGWAESPVAFLSRAGEMADKALSLDDSEVRARIILGYVHIFHQRYEQAAAEIERAVAINPSDAHGLAGQGNILVWLGQTDAAIESLELAQRIDPELNAIDRFALSMAYYLKRRYDAAIEQAERNLRKTIGANFTRIVLAAAYAQLDRAEDAARVVSMIHRTEPTFDPQRFGTKFLKPDDLEHLRDGLRKAGLYPPDGVTLQPDTSR
jgi:TolB-like protein/DNA-binding winged helix-turn-helix (wHTH) protein/cytochrome c-type biogenesis protein CcmH/NrfG